jgi:uncharacterized coiled-coil DUF342 family protein
VNEKIAITKNLQAATESKTQLQAENWDLRNLERTLRDKIARLDREINEIHRSRTRPPPFFLFPYFILHDKICL